MAQLGSAFALGAKGRTFESYYPDMAYLFSDEELIEALHALRWHEELPTEVNGLNPNLLIETAIDRIRVGMKIAVDIPDPIVLSNGHDKVTMLVGPGMDRVVVDGSGDIIISRNGGGPLAFKLNVSDLIKEYSPIRRIE